MGKKEREEEKKRAKALKEAQKQAKKEAKEKAKRAKQEKKEAKERERAQRNAKKEGWHTEHKARYNLDDQKLDMNDTIWVAAAQGNVTRLQKFVADGLGIGARDQDGNTALHCSARNGHVECLKWILATGKLDVNMQNRWGMTALHEAVFQRQAKAAEWLVLHGANLHILTEGGISPLEKAFEIDEAMSALLVHRAAYVEENGAMSLNMEQNEAQYKDVAVKWGEQTIYVENSAPEKETERSSETASEQDMSVATSGGVPLRAEAVDRSVRATLSPEELQQQQELLRVQELAASSTMQESLIQRQLQELETTGDSGGVVPALRSMTASASDAPPVEKKTIVKAEVGSSVYDMLALAKERNDSAITVGPAQHEGNFARALDSMTSSMAQFVQVLVDGISRGAIHQTQGLSTREERNANLRIALKAIAVSLKQLFETLKPFAMTKLDPSERTGVFKSATELQAAVKNLAQGVRGHCNALPQFHSQACQQLVILSQAFVAAVWNLHKAAEHIAGDALVEEAKEYSATLRQVVLGAIGKGLDAGLSFADVVAYALKQEARLHTLVNAKMIELFNSHSQTDLSNVAHSIAKASDGVIRAAEQVYSNPRLPANRKAMGALVRIAAAKLTALCDFCLSHDLQQVVNFIDPAVVAKAIDDSCAVLRNAVAKAEAARPQAVVDELSEFRVGGGAEEEDDVGKLLAVVRKEVGEVEQLRVAVAPQTYDKSKIMASVQTITACVEDMTEVALHVAKESAFTANMELSLMEALRAAAYFASQLRVIASATALGHPITTDVLLYFTLRFTVQSTVGILQIVSTIASATDSSGVDNMIDNLMADFDSPTPAAQPVPASPGFNLPATTSQSSVLAMETELQNDMRTIRAKPHGAAAVAAVAPNAQPHLASPVNTRAASFETIRSGLSLVGQSVAKPSDVGSRPGPKGSPAVARVAPLSGGVAGLPVPASSSVALKPTPAPTPTAASVGAAPADDIDRLFAELQEDRVKAAGAVPALSAPAPAPVSVTGPEAVGTHGTAQASAPALAAGMTATEVPAEGVADRETEGERGGATSVAGGAAAADLDALFDELENESGSSASHVPPVLLSQPTSAAAVASAVPPAGPSATAGTRDELDDLFEELATESGPEPVPAVSKELSANSSAALADLDDLLDSVTKEKTLPPSGLAVSPSVTAAPAASAPPADDLDDLLGELAAETAPTPAAVAVQAATVSSSSVPAAYCSAPEVLHTPPATDELDDLLGELGSEGAVATSQPRAPSVAVTPSSSKSSAPTGVDDLDDLLGELATEMSAPATAPAGIPATAAVPPAATTTPVPVGAAADDLDDLLGELAAESTPAPGPATAVSVPITTAMPPVAAAQSSRVDELDDLLSELAGEMAGPSAAEKAEEERKALAQAKRQEEERKRREEEDRKATEEKERLERERLEKERLEKESAEREERERAEKERLEKERAERERAERLEKERLEKERLERKRLERERLERERAERERAEKERRRVEELEKQRVRELEEKQRRERPAAAGAAVEVANELDELLSELSGPSVPATVSAPAPADEEDDLLELDELLEELDGF